MPYTKKTKDHKTVTINIDSKLHEEVTQYCLEDGRTFTWVIEKMLLLYLRIKKACIPHAWDIAIALNNLIDSKYTVVYKNCTKHKNICNKCPNVECKRLRDVL